MASTDAFRGRGCAIAVSVLSEGDELTTSLILGDVALVAFDGGEQPVKMIAKSRMLLTSSVTITPPPKGLRVGVHSVDVLRSLHD